MSPVDGVLFALLVLAAGGYLVLATMAFGLRRQIDKVEKDVHARLDFAWTTLEALRKQSPVKLAADVEDLADAVERLRATHQKFAGRFDRERGRHPEQALAHTLGNGALEPDDDVAAMIALQSAPAARPNE